MHTNLLLLLLSAVRPYYSVASFGTWRFWLRAFLPLGGHSEQAVGLAELENVVCSQHRHLATHPQLGVVAGHLRTVHHQMARERLHQLLGYHRLIEFHHLPIAVHDAHSGHLMHHAIRNRAPHLATYQPIQALNSRTFTYMTGWMDDG